VSCSSEDEVLEFSGFRTDVVSLFLSGEAKARVMAYFGEGAGPIHLDNVKCGGEERSLADCIKQAPGTHNCRHSEDAGVICDHGVTPPGAREGKGQSGVGLGINGASESDSVIR